MTASFTDIPPLDAAGLRRFGLILSAMIALVFGALLPWLFGFSVPLWPFVAAGALGAWSLLAPSTLNVVYRPWMALGFALNRVTTPLIMGLVFFLLITPVSLVMKIIRRDPLARDFEPQARSYRKASRKAPPESLERPF